MSTRGIHIVWTTYGTWLPGDERGHWSPLFDLYGRLRGAGNRLNMPEPVTRRAAMGKLVEPAKRLSAPERLVIGHAIGETLRPTQDARGCLAAAIEEDHVHLLFAPLHEDIGRFVGRLKGRSSASLIALPTNAHRRHVWTAGYWHVFLFDDDAIPGVRAYITEHNVRRGMPADPYAWVTRAAM